MRVLRIFGVQRVSIRTLARNTKNWRCFFTKRCKFLFAAAAAASLNISPTFSPSLPLSLSPAVRGGGKGETHILYPSRFLLLRCFLPFLSFSPSSPRSFITATSVLVSVDVVLCRRLLVHFSPQPRVEFNFNETQTLAAVRQCGSSSSTTTAVKQQCY